MNEPHFCPSTPTGGVPGTPHQQANNGSAEDLAKTAARELYYLTCEMHAELWRLERMAQAYSRFDVLQLKTGALSAQADAILRMVKPYISPQHTNNGRAGGPDIAAGSALPAVLEGELDRAACDLAMELLRVEELRQSDLRVADFNVEPRLFTRMDEVRARMDELVERAAETAGEEARLPSALYSCPLWVIKTAGSKILTPQHANSRRAGDPKLAAKTQ